VDPSTDWIAAYAGGAVVGTVRVAVTRTALGVLDNIRVAESHRRRGFGRCLLARGLSALAGRTDVVWTDTDDDHPGARRFYEKAGFRVRHRHGGISLELVQS
jgi:ribosomal protein S18 acetylase RimI-like enzyme